MSTLIFITNLIPIIFLISTPYIFIISNSARD